MYQKLGSDLTVVEATPTLLPGTDPECTEVVEKKLVKHGAKILKNAKAMGYERQADGSLAVRVDVSAAGGVASTQRLGGKNETVVCDVVLVAVGMRPNSTNLGLEKVGVKVEKSFVPTDNAGRTNVPGVYAIGDVSGFPMLAHKATKEGEVIAEVIAGQKAAKDWVAIAAAIFTDPEIASAGPHRAAGEGQGHRGAHRQVPVFAALGRAMANNETEGFFKVVANAKTHEVLGIHIVGTSASDMISEAALALEMHAFLEDVALTIHPHPTLGEGMMEAHMNALGHAIHVLNR